MECLFENDCNIEREFELDPLKIYNFPKNIDIIYYKCKYLIIASDYGNWIVLDNKIQVQIFNKLKNNSIEQVLLAYDNHRNDVEQVLKQLEARHFENTNTIRKSDGKGVQLYLTNQCNLRCPHCYMKSGNVAEDELTNKEWLDIIDNVAANGTDRITFSGGEPTVHPHVKDYIVKAHELGMSVDLLSNGLLITEEFLHDCEFALSRVQISIDGFSEATNSIHRGSGNFNKALHTVDLLLNRGITTDIGITPPFSTSLHLHIDEYISFIRKMRAKYKDKPLNIALTGSLMDGRNLNLNSKEHKYYSDCIDEICRKSFGIHYRKIGFIQFKKLFGIDDNCPYGDLHISSKGDVYFCSHISSMKAMGNVRNLTWKQIFEKSEEARNISNIDNIIPCSECSLKYICGGNCRIENMPGFLDCSSLPLHPYRKCTIKDKEEIYQLMIETNEYIYQ